MTNCRGVFFSFILIAIFLFSLLQTPFASAKGEAVTVTTLAGLAGNFAHVDGVGSVARFDSPKAMTVDSSGNVYTVDNFCGNLRKITPAGLTTTPAGPAAPACGPYGSADGTGIAANFNAPSGTAADSAGNIFIADTVNCTVRKVTPAGVVSTIAGQVGSCASVDGTGAAARFENLAGIAVDSANNVYVSSYVGCTIRKITPAAVVTTFIGQNRVCAEVDGIGTDARLNNPSGVAVDSSFNLYVADESGHTIRKITPAGVVTTMAGLSGVTGSADGIGAAARFNVPSWTAVDAVGNVYVSDYLNATIRKVTQSGVVTTIAGLAGVTGSTDGAGADARFLRPDGIGVDSNGIVYVADRNNSTVRKLTIVFTVPGAPTSVNAVTGDARATITFTPSDIDGGTAVTGYTATSNPGNITATSSTSPITVTGLTNGTSYTFTVTATNAVGTSSSSTASNSVIGAVPVISSISSGTPGPDSAVISWTTDVTSNSLVEYGSTSSYTASSSLNSSLVTVHSVSLTGLAHAATYHFRVLSSNGNLAVSSDQTFTTTAVPGANGSGSSLSFAITNFQAIAGDAQILLSWVNPSNPSFASLALVRKSGSSSPVSLSDGLKVFQGMGQSFFDSNLSNGQVYSYALFPLNSSGEALTPVLTVQAAPRPNIILPIPIAAGTSPGITLTPGLTMSETSNVSVRLINDNGIYFLIVNGVKHGITNPGILNSFGFSLSDAVLATSQDALIPQGILLLPGDGSLIKSSQDPTIYLVSLGQRYGFTSAGVFSSLGFKFSSVVVVTNPELQALPKVSNISDPKASHFSGVNINSNGTVYRIGTDGLRHPYQSLETYNSWNIDDDFSRVVPANSADLLLPAGDAVVMRVRG